MGRRDIQGKGGGMRQRQRWEILGIGSRNEYWMCIGRCYWEMQLLPCLFISPPLTFTSGGKIGKEVCRSSKAGLRSCRWESGTRTDSEISGSTWVGPCKDTLESTVEGMFLGQHFSNHLLDALKTLNVNTNISQTSAPWSHKFGKNC